MVLDSFWACSSSFCIWVEKGPMIPIVQLMSGMSTRSWNKFWLFEVPMSETKWICVCFLKYSNLEESIVIVKIMDLSGLISNDPKGSSMVRVLSVWFWVDEVGGGDETTWFWGNCWGLVCWEDFVWVGELEGELFVFPWGLES